MHKVSTKSIVIREYAPIILFAFNRPNHTAITLQALQTADLANMSELYVFLDGPRNDIDKQKINETLCEIQKASIFRRVVIKQRVENIGLARNICEGIDEVFTKHNAAIILEDDVVVSKNFLSFMNSALTYYSAEKKIWHIAAYNLSIESDDETRTFFWRAMSCWGWATWRDRWAHFKKEPSSLINSFSKQDIYSFNLDGSEDFWSQVLANYSGKINTWAVFWYATIFQNDGLCLNPVVSLVKNIGFDGSGVHCGYDDSVHSVGRKNSSELLFFPAVQVEDNEILQKIKLYYLKSKPTLIRRVINKFSRLLKQS
jgi:GR25 family glycosyltransferase involved in LPS biosynthesis